MIRILIVEDELPIANLIRLSLSKAGYTCDCVYDGAAAADQIAARTQQRRCDAHHALAGKRVSAGENRGFLTGKRLRCILGRSNAATG